MNRVMANPQMIGRYPVATVSVPEERRHLMALPQPEAGVIAPSRDEQAQEQREPMEAISATMMMRTTEASVIAPLRAEQVQVQGEPMQACSATMMMRSTSGLFQNTKFENCTFHFSMTGANNS